MVISTSAFLALSGCSENASNKEKGEFVGYIVGAGIGLALGDDLGIGEGVGMVLGDRKSVV